MNGAKRYTEATEAGSDQTDQLMSRIVEKLADAPDGGRQYRVRVISAGESLNKRFYPEAVLHSAQHLYEGAKVFDGHRTDAAMASSGVGSIIGSVHTVEAVPGGLDATLHLLDTPNGKNAASVLDASLAAEALHRPALAGLSHDVLMETRKSANGVQEATKIGRVLSVDVVADPAAGGRAQRALAGGVQMNLRALLEKLAKATDEAARKAILGTDEAKALLDGAGYTEADALLMAAALNAPEPKAEGDPKTDPAKTDPAKAEGDPKAEPKAGDNPSSTEPEPVLVAAESLTGRGMIREALADVPEGVAREAIRATIPATFTDASLLAVVLAGRRMAEALAGGGGSKIPPTTGADVKVTDELDRKLEALDLFWAGDSRGYRSLKQAWIDITGRQSVGFLETEDMNRAFMREAKGGRFDSGDRPLDLYSPREGDTPAKLRQRSVESYAATGDTARGVEALVASSWNLVLGDSVTRRMIALYSMPDLQNWRRIVSNIANVNDFRLQRLDRIGGYAAPLPAVSEGAPYQPLTSPTNEEVTYSITKRGGTESITFEMIQNDDMRAVQQIPGKLARSAAITLFRFVWDIFVTNAAIYDSVALFNAGHLNTTSAALSTTALEATRSQMRRLAAYGNSTEILGLTPRFLVTGSSLEPLAYEICTSAFAIPAGAPVGAATNTPNLHQGLIPLIVDYWSSQTAWYVVADPSQVPTFEVGFLNGRDAPELFTQDMPTVGSMFDNDMVTYKIRHIYGAAVLDYRGLSRGNS